MYTTIVALRAMLQAVDAGAQAALLAPTEVLAAQHARTIAGMLGPLARAGELDGAEDATRITLLTASLGAAARRRSAEFAPADMGHAMLDLYAAQAAAPQKAAA